MRKVGFSSRPGASNSLQSSLKAQPSFVQISLKTPYNEFATEFNAVSLDRLTSGNGASLS